MRPSGNRRGNIEGVRLNPTLQASPQVLLKLLQNDSSPDETVKVTLKRVFDRYLELVKLSTVMTSARKLTFKIIGNSAFDPAPDFLTHPEVAHVKTFSPLELLATAVLIFKHGESSMNDVLVEDIKEMRYYLRQKHKDLRLNNICWITAWTFINSGLIKLRGEAGDVPRRRMAAGVAGEVFDDEGSQQSRTTRARQTRGAFAVNGPTNAPRYFAPTSGNLSIDQGNIRGPNAPNGIRSSRQADLNEAASPSLATTSGHLGAVSINSSMPACSSSQRRVKDEDSGETSSDSEPASKKAKHFQ